MSASFRCVSEYTGRGGAEGSKGGGVGRTGVRGKKVSSDGGEGGLLGCGGDEKGGRVVLFVALLSFLLGIDHGRESYY